MSIALTHFAFGALAATLLLAYLPVETRYHQPLAIASGIWAMLPDVWRVTPVWEPGFRELGQSLLGNGFWLHSLLDHADPTDSTRLAAVMVGVYLLVAVIHAERHRDHPGIAVDWTRSQE